MHNNGNRCLPSCTGLCAGGCPARPVVYLLAEALWRLLSSLACCLPSCRGPCGGCCPALPVVYLLAEAGVELVVQPCLFYLSSCRGLCCLACFVYILAESLVQVIVQPGLLFTFLQRPLWRWLSSLACCLPSCRAIVEVVIQPGLLFTFL